MPMICPHCHKMVAERPTCPNCGKALSLAPADGLDRAAMVILMRYALMWVLGIVGVGLLCMVMLYWIL